jgi:cell division septal protein FtsQ
VVAVSCLVLQIRDLPIKQVRLGYGNYGQKLRRLEKVLVYLENKEPSVEFEKMDLRNPDRIVARPAADKQSQTIGQKEEA